MERQAPRLPFDLRAEVKVGSGAWTRVRLSDMSTSGFRFARYPDVRVGQPVMIRLPGLQLLTATVRHRTAEGIGCEFARPLSAYVLEHLARGGR